MQNNYQSKSTSQNLQLATWCKGGCGRFRKPYAFFEDKPVCCNCARLIENTASNRPKLELVSTNTQKRVSKSLNTSVPLTNSGTELYPYCDLKAVEIEIRSNPFLPELILKLLAENPKSDRALAAKLKCQVNTINKIAEDLLAVGKIVKGIANRKLNGAKSLFFCYYALNGQQNRLDILVNLSYRERICQLLRLKFRTIKDLKSNMPDYSYKSISKILASLIKDGTVTYLDTNVRWYALSEERENLLETILPTEDRIFNLVLENPGISRRKIYTKLNLSEPYVKRHLNKLVSEKRIAITEQSKKNLQRNHFRYYVQPD